MKSAWIEPGPRRTRRPTYHLRAECGEPNYPRNLWPLLRRVTVDSLEAVPETLRCARCWR
jgi:hypothetical protein